MRILTPIAIMGLTMILMGSTLKDQEPIHSASLLMRDFWIPENQAIWLRARLRSTPRFWPQRWISGERVRFSVNGTTVGTALTDGRGIASYKLENPIDRGAHTITGTLAQSSRYSAEDSESLFHYGRFNKKIILVSLNTLRSSPRPNPLGLAWNQDLLPQTEARQVLNDLSQLFELIYYLEGDLPELPGLRRWLAQHNFPKGLLLLVQGSNNGMGEDHSLVRDINSLKTVSSLFLGISESRSEAKIFQSAGMKSVILSEEEELEAPEGSLVIQDWALLPAFVTKGE